MLDFEELQVDEESLKEYQEDSNGARNGDEPKYHIGQHVCVLNAFIAEITKVFDKDPIGGHYLYQSTIIGYTDKAKDVQKRAFPVGKENYGFYEHLATPIDE